ncbi:MAG TPA: MarR family transcriptional regulator [Fibrobacteres bacterium]|jgi:DNA-binding MarR family transcriptional regulator|nr:MarR family transcriptional regulator [Fibrobacterota bacterium]
MRSEIKQAKPFSSPEEELFLSLVHTSDIAARKLSDFLKEHKISTAQYNVLRILRGAGPNGLPCGEISSRMVTRDPDITRLLDRLEKRKLVGRSRLSGDRRVVSTRISPDGLALLKILDKPMVEIHQQQLGFLSATEIQELLKAFTRIRAHLSEEAPE